MKTRSKATLTLRTMLAEDTGLGRAPQAAFVPLVATEALLAT